MRQGGSWKHPKWKKPKKKKFTGSLKKVAEKLETNLPSSEKWFRVVLEKFKIELNGDKFNQVFDNTFIPDVWSEEFKYIIEIDGEIHNDPEVQKRDLKKTLYFRERGYRIFRIKAYDLMNFVRDIILILKIRGQAHPEEFTIFLRSIALE